MTREEQHAALLELGFKWVRNLHRYECYHKLNHTLTLSAPTHRQPSTWIASATGKWSERVSFDDPLVAASYLLVEASNL